jgi:MerR family transcriptional regulator, copper efflux regulator
MKIGEFARRAGVTASAIRFYEKRGLMPVSRRQANGYRSYRTEDLRVIELIGQARELGFSLQDVERFMKRPPIERRDKARLLPVLEAKLALLDNHLAAIEQQRTAIKVFMEQIKHAGASERMP